jgi:Xaa-Pro dipeptidase
MDPGVDLILASKYPAKEHAKRVGNLIRQLGHGDSGIIYLEGQKTRMIEDSDAPMPFRLDIPSLICLSTSIFLR